MDGCFLCGSALLAFSGAKMAKAENTGSENGGKTTENA